MATRRASPRPVSPRPGWRHPLLLPGALAVVAGLLLMAGMRAFAFSFLLFALGLLLWLMGKALRWKGAPEAGIVVGVVGAVIALWALFG